MTIVSFYLYRFQCQAQVDDSKVFNAVHGHYENQLKIYKIGSKYLTFYL